MAKARLSIPPSVPRSLNTPESSTNAWYSPPGVVHCRWPAVFSDRRGDLRHCVLRMVGRDGDECRHDVVVGLHGERAGARPIADVPGPQGEPGPPGGTRGHGHLGPWRQVEGARVRTVDPV